MFLANETVYYPKIIKQSQKQSMLSLQILKDKQDMTESAVNTI